jgi:uncharacterized protein DUF1028
MAEHPIATYSIVPSDLEAGHWSVATQSRFLAVGSVVPWAEPHAGAIATQSYANPSYPDGLRLLRKGLSADDTVAQLTEADEGREQRQLGVVDALGRGATFTGSECEVDAALAAELRRRLAVLGYDGELADAMRRSSGNENLEERMDGIERLDPVVLDALGEAG